jgi:serine/threonine protein kinase
MWHNQDIESLEKIKTEALIMERLTSSPVIANIYGHCGTSTIVEMGNEITNDIVPYNEDYMMSRGRMKQRYLDQLEFEANGNTNDNTNTNIKPYSMNNLTTVEKLDIALAMAIGIAEHHGYKESVIVNDDAHPDQWLVTDDGRYIFNDMNNAIFLKWNFYKKEYCKYSSSYGGDYRSPEEVQENGSDVDETVDIWPMGNLILSLLTGLWPYYTLPTEHDVIRVLTKENPQYPPYNSKFDSSSYIEHQLVTIMKSCHQFNPKDRISIFDVVQQLQETKRIYERTKGKVSVNK